jgi:hypothetical protein
VGFPFVDVARGRPLPSTSLSARLGSGERTGWAELDHGVWLSGEGGRRGALQEQALRLANGWMMTLLVCERHEEEDEEILDSLDVWENPRFPSGRRRR